MAKLAALLQVVRVIQVGGYVEVSPLSHASYTLTFYSKQEIQKTQASWGQKMGELYISEWWQRTESPPPAELHLAPSLNKYRTSAVLCY